MALERAKEIIGIIAGQTDSILLFHSLSGKDSTVMLDLCYGRFKRIVCCYMYIVKGLESQERFLVWAEKRYPGVRFVQVPSFILFSYIKTGLFGIKKNPKQRLWTLAEITDKLREKLGIKWACYGFKQSDSLNRRLMLRSYKDGKESICWKTKKFYPLSTYKNGDIIDYIQNNNLKTPEAFGTKSQSYGVAVANPEYLSYLKQRWPDDLKKIYSVFPLARVVMADYNNKKNNGEEDNRKQDSCH